MKLIYSVVEVNQNSSYFTLAYSVYQNSNFTFYSNFTFEISRFLYPSQWNKLAKKILEEKKISKEILKQFAESIPAVQLSVKFDENKNSFYNGPKFDSIFVIATYALIRLVITNEPNMDDTDTRKTLFVCEACGKINVKTGNRQKYCDTASCQNVRNSRKTARSKKRKKDK